MSDFHKYAAEVAAEMTAKSGETWTASGEGCNERFSWITRESDGYRFGGWTQWDGPRVAWEQGGMKMVRYSEDTPEVTTAQGRPAKAVGADLLRRLVTTENVEFFHECQRRKAASDDYEARVKANEGVFEQVGFSASYDGRLSARIGGGWQRASAHGASADLELHDLPVDHAVKVIRLLRELNGID